MGKNKEAKQQELKIDLEKVIEGVVTRPNVPVENAVAPHVAVVLANEIVSKLPQLQHMFSTENWWQSRANWAAIVGLVAAIAGAFNYTFMPEHRDLMETVLLVGSSIALPLYSAYLAWRARRASKPLGE